MPLIPSLIITHCLENIRLTNPFLEIRTCRVNDAQCCDFRTEAYKRRIGIYTLTGEVPVIN
jgi:hypothetical protein